METNSPTPYQRKTMWKAATGLAILVIGLLLVGLIWVTSNVLSFLQPVLLPVAVAGVIAYLLDPIVARLQSKGMSRLKSVLSVFGSFLLLLTVLGFIIIPPIVTQVSDKKQREQVGSRVISTVERLGETAWLKPVVSWAVSTHQEPALKTIAIPAAETAPAPETNAVKPKFSETNLANYISENTGKIAAFAGRLITSGTSTFIGTFGLLIGLAMVPIYLYYFLKEGSAIKNNWHDYVPLKASRFKTEVVDTLAEINGYLISFFRGQVLVAMIDGLLVGIALAIFQLPYGVLIGLILGIIGIIPFVGNIICLIPACFIAYVHFSSPSVHTHEWLLGSNPWAYVAAVAAIFVVVQQINSLVTAPKIVGESVGLHPMTVIFSMLFWSLILGGILGALLAVPMTAAVKVLFRRYVWERKINPINGEEHAGFTELPEELDELEDLGETAAP
ncbi:MAG: putative PurR-regulated permease PerM [Rubritalea sp.]|jgi:predicted PurR-regulated permease PerM